MLVLEKCNTKTKGNNNTKIFHEIYNCLIDLIYIKCFCLPPVGKFMSPVFSHLCKLSLYNPFYNYILGTFCRIYRIVIRVYLLFPPYSSNFYLPDLLPCCNLPPYLPYPYLPNPYLPLY